MSDRLCLPFSEITRHDVLVAGGKGANLGEMVQAGLPVPPGFVITSSAYRKMFEGSGLDKIVQGILSGIDRNDSQALLNVEPQIRSLFDKLVIDPTLRDEILERYHGLGNDIPVAVRSSATAEDLISASFAGQQSTYLNIFGDDELIRNVLLCWSSLYTCQAIYYRSRNGIDDTQVSMAIVVQKMVSSDKAGVIFTIDPVSKNPYQMIIEGVYGLGEGIVSGTITPDHYKVDRETFEIRFKYVAPKTIMFSKDSVGGVIEMPVSADRKDTPVLTEDELHWLIDMANRVEKHFGSPQDIEWGAENGTFYLLQSRPITTL